MGLNPAGIQRNGSARRKPAIERRGTMAPEISTARDSAARDKQCSRSGPLGAAPRIHRRAPQMQAYIQLVGVPIALAEKARSFQCPH
jgi:hypothetical protein